jgi:hypothetical protein
MAAYNLYRGNGSRAERVDDRRREGPSQQPTRPPRPQQSPAHRPPPAPVPPLGKLPILGDLPKKLGELETEDLLLILILYLMYRESGDRELLIIMGAMYLL